jgi:hypothetical protein
MTLPNVLLPFASPVAGMPDDQTRNIVRGNDNTLLRAVNAIRDYVAAGIPVPDGDYGDITVSSSGTVWTLDLTLDAIPVAVASVNFNDQQATSFRVENRTSDPGTPTTGQIWLRTDL